MNTKQLIYRWLNNRLAAAGLHLQRAPVYEQDRYFVSERHIERHAQALARAATDFFNANPGLVGTVAPDKLLQLAREYIPLYRQHPVRLSKGGSNFNSCFWLFVSARLVEPEVIIESGSFRGQSAWILNKAAPQAQMYCFDLNTTRFELDEPNIALIEQDWSEYDFTGVDLSRHLCYFDDHVDQARRVQEASERGLDMLVFDDDAPAMHIPSDADPGPLTISMLYDDELEDGEEFVWRVGDSERRYIFSADYAAAARELIADYAKMPQLLEVNGYQRQSGMSMVRLHAQR